MKALYVVMAFSLLLLTVCAFLANHIVSTCDELIDMKNEAVDWLHRGDLKQTTQTLLALQEVWQAHNAQWEMLCDHEDLNMVTNAIKRALIFCANESEALLEAECSTIESALINLAEKESLAITSII